MGRYLAGGYVVPSAPPRIEPRPGYVTQPQVNLIWKLARDLSIPEGSLDEWLATCAGIEGGLSGMTAAGARYVIDRMLKPVIAMRELGDEQVRDRTARQLEEAAAVP